MYRGFSIDAILDFILVVCSMGLRLNDRGELTIDCPCVAFHIFVVFVTGGIQFENSILAFIFRNSLKELVFFRGS